MVFLCLGSDILLSLEPWSGFGVPEDDKPIDGGDFEKDCLDDDVDFPCELHSKRG